MVDDDIAKVVAMRIAVHGVVLCFLLVAHATANKAYDDVAGINIKGVVLQADAIAGSSLSQDGDVAIVDFQRTFQLNDARHVEYDDACATGLTGCTQRTGAGVVEVGHMNDLAASTAGCSPACRTFRSGESRRCGLCGSQQRHDGNC